jgi:ribonuclease P protein component
MFAALRAEGRRVRRGPVTITWLPGDDGQPPRVAYAIGRRVGGAVVRNRVRRRLRAVTADLTPRMRPGAYLFGAGREAASVPYEELKRAVTEALADLAEGRPAT